MERGMKGESQRGEANEAETASTWSSNLDILSIFCFPSQIDREHGPVFPDVVRFKRDWGNRVTVGVYRRISARLFLFLATDVAVEVCSVDRK